jgi:hypothetical protein
MGISDCISQPDLHVGHVGSSDTLGDESHYKYSIRESDSKSSLLCWATGACYLVEALPTIKMAALGHDGLARGIEADVTVKLATSFRPDPHSLIAGGCVGGG